MIATSGIFLGEDVDALFTSKVSGSRVLRDRLRTHESFHSTRKPPEDSVMAKKKEKKVSNYTKFCS